MRVRIAAFIGPALIGFFIVLTAVFVFGDNGKPKESQSAGQSKVRTDKKNPDPVYKVTPVRGPSWLKQIGVFDINASPMGEMGGNGPPPPSPRKEPKFPVEAAPLDGRMGMGGMMGRSYSNYQLDPSEVEKLTAERFLLAGIDLYRLNCQSCHGPNGNGAPPEIHSLIAPFQGTSPALIEERAKKSGKPMNKDLAKEVAKLALGNILQLLQKGSNKMPPFRHLEGEEINALIQYLKVHVGVPEAKGKTILVTESTSRVGEHLVKGTCHICHDAMGPGRGHMGMMQGIIPSLASFPYEQSMQSIVWTVGLGSRMMMGGQRMPAYPYITADEAAAAYLYLLKYPPY